MPDAVKPLPQIGPPSSNTYAQKARALLGLLGPDGLARLSAQGLGASVMDAIGQESQAELPSDLAWRQNDILGRLRAKGILSKLDPNMPQLADPKTLAVPREDIALHWPERVSALLDPADLASEHPSVIAMTLKDRPAAERARFLRSLPGIHARSVLRAARKINA
jgi:hypothetical protein